MANYRPQDGKALASGLGRGRHGSGAGRSEWLRDRLREAEQDHPRRTTWWGRAAMIRADLHVRWSVTADRGSAAALERAVLAAFRENDLWNRRR